MARLTVTPILCSGALLGTAKRPAHVRMKSLPLRPAESQSDAKPGGAWIYASRRGPCAGGRADARPTAVLIRRMKHGRAGDIFLGCRSV